MHFCKKFALSFSFCLGISGASASALVDFTGQCIGQRVLSTPNSRAAAPALCTDSTVQTLTFSSLGEIRAQGWCLGIADANTAPTARAVWAGCIGTVNLLWKIEGNQIVSMMHGLCLSRPYRAAESFDSYVLLECDNSVRQQWRFLR
jgi:hypothetical protein